MMNKVSEALRREKSAATDRLILRLSNHFFTLDLLILIEDHRKWNWLERAIHIRLRQELSKIKVNLNEEKTKMVDLKQGRTFSFLGFDFRRVLRKGGKTGILKTPRMKARTTLLSTLKVIFRNYIWQPVGRVISLVNAILRGWTNYFRIGNSGRCFGYIKDWVAKKVRRHLMRARQKKGFGWGRWSRRDLYEKIKLYNDYQIRLS